MSDGVVEHVADELIEPMSVAPNLHRFDTAGIDGYSGPQSRAIAHLVDDIVEIDRSPARLHAGLIDPGEKQQVVDQAGHPMVVLRQKRRRPQPIGRIGCRESQIQLGSTRRQRALQLV